MTAQQVTGDAWVPWGPTAPAELLEDGWGLGPDAPTGPTYRPASFLVYPTGYDQIAAPEKRNWCLTVADAGDGWSIRWRSRCLNYREQWEFEPPVRARTADFLRRCRFSQYAALQRARHAVDDLVVNGETFAEFVERVRAEAAAAARGKLADHGGMLRLYDDPAAAPDRV
jgi:hypothetical protein